MQMIRCCRRLFGAVSRRNAIDGLDRLKKKKENNQSPYCALLMYCFINSLF